MQGLQHYLRARTDTLRAPRKSLSVQYTAFLIHSFVGLKLSLLFTVVLLSGALAVLALEIDWLLYSEFRASSGEVRLGAGELLDRLQAAYPEFGLSFFETMNQHPGFASFAMFNDAAGGFRYAWIDPYTGEVNGDTPVLTPGRFIGFLHSTLYLPVIGRSVVNVFGVLTLLSLIAGLYAYPKFWRFFFRIPRTGNARVFWSDLHKLIGLWSLWFVLIIGVTGTWWFYENPLVSHLGAPNPVEPANIKPLLSYEDMDNISGTMLSASSMITTVRKAYPDALILGINPPEHNADPYTVTFAGDAWLVPDGRQNKLYLNPFTAEIIASHTVDKYTAAQRADMAMSPLHLGNWASGNPADLPVKLIWFVFGMGMTVLCISGLIINLKRTARAARIVYSRNKIIRRLHKSWRIIRPWGPPFGLFKYMNVLLILGIGAGCGIALTLSSQGTKGAGFLYQPQPVGNWEVSMNAVAGLLEKDLNPIRPDATVNFNVELPDGAAEAFRFAYLRVGEPRTLRAPGILIHGPKGSRHADIHLPRTLTGNEKIWLTAIGWNGQVYQTQWSLNANGKETIDGR